MIFKSHGKSKLAQQAFSAHLFIKNWQMQDLLQEMITSTRTPNTIVVAYTEQGKAVGCLVGFPVLMRTPDKRFTKKKVYREIEKTIVMFFVKPSCRRQGIGKSMFSYWKQKYGNDQLLGLEGKEGSADFFRHCKVPTKLRYSKPKNPLKSLFQVTVDEA